MYDTTTHTEAKREIIADIGPDWTVSHDGQLVCPCGHPVEDDGECPNGHVSPLRVAGLI